MKAVRATIKNDEKLKKLGSIEGMIKKMVDYLQNLQKNEPRKDPKELSVIQKKDMVEQWLKSTDCQARGVLPIMAYTGRLRPKGYLFQASGI